MTVKGYSAFCPFSLFFIEQQESSLTFMCLEHKHALVPQLALTCRSPHFLLCIPLNRACSAALSYIHQCVLSLAISSTSKALFQTLSYLPAFRIQVSNITSRESFLHVPSKWNPPKPFPSLNPTLFFKS